MGLDIEAPIGDGLASGEGSQGLARLLYIAGLLWLGYLLLFFGIDRLFVAEPPGLGYYVLNGACALIVLGLAWWRGSQAVLGRAFLPLGIFLMSAPPVLANHLFGPLSIAGAGGGPGLGGPPPLPGPTTSAEGMSLRLLPVLFMALVLTAWRYRWPQVVLFSLGTAGLTLALLLPSRMP